MNKAYICDCCGGKVDPVTLTCEYCGTVYKKDIDDHFIRIETFTNPVVTLTSKINIGDMMSCGMSSDDISKMVMNTMVRELSEVIAPYISLQMERDETTGYNVRGIVKVVLPVNKGGIK